MSEIGKKRRFTCDTRILYALAAAEFVKIDKNSCPAIALSTSIYTRGEIFIYKKLTRISK